MASGASQAVASDGINNGVAVEKTTAPPTVQVSKRLEKFQTSIFTQMTALAIKHQALNLGQGFPDFDGPDFIKEAAIEAIKTVGKNQYARGYGIPDLNRAIAARFKKDSGLDVDPETEVTVTTGCTEALSATMLGLLNPGDEVILFAPFFDVYEQLLAMVDATIKVVTLRPPDFSVPEKELCEAFSSKTRAILVNTPHNPTGKVFSRKELELIASLCIKNDALAFTDEVYSKLIFRGEHISIATLDGMYERTVTMNSMAKTFSLTGWKVGWAIAPPQLSWGLRIAHSNLTFSTSTPLQWGALAALQAPDAYYADLAQNYKRRKDYLVQNLKSIGFKVYEPHGTYFVMADHTPFGFDDDTAFVRHLIKNVGVAAIPPSGFYENVSDGKHLVRFAFCKDDATLRKAVERMKIHLKPASLKSTNYSEN